MILPVQTESMWFQKAIQELQKLADELDIHIIVGTINYVDSKYYNRAYLVSPNKAKRWYDKRALYGWDEDNFAPGDENGIYEIDGIKIGVRICFEVRFPEYFRELYRENTDLDIVLFMMRLIKRMRLGTR